MSLRDAIDSLDVDQVERYAYWCQAQKSCSFSYGDADESSVLHVAARTGDIRLVRLLIESGVDADACTKSGMSPIAIASGEGKADVVAELLRVGADANGKCTTGSGFPLLVAANAAVARQLIQAGASIEKPGWSGETALRNAASWRRTDVIAVLLEHGASVEAPVGGSTVSVLHTAIMGTAGDPIGSIKLLLDAGADPNRRFDHLTRGAHGQTPLIEAVTRDEAEIAELLLKAGADVNASTAEGQTALLHAVSVFSHSRHLTSSSSTDPESMSRQRQRAAKQTDFVRLLLAAGADVSLKNLDGATPLHAAARAGNESVVELLLQWKADVAATDAKGATPLHYAAEGGSVQVAEALLRAGADVNAVTTDGELPSTWARRHVFFTSDDHARLLKLLRDSGETLRTASLTPPSTAAKTGTAPPSRTANDTIDKASAAKVLSTLGPAHSWILERGATLKLGKYRKASLPAAFSQATEAYSARVHQQGWSLVNYVAGLPFPTIDRTHPQSGRHLIFNVEAAGSLDDLHVMQVECDTAAIGKNANEVVVERHLKSRSIFRLGFAGRWEADPKPLLEPNRDAVRYKEMMLGLIEPFDQQGNAWTAFRYLDDDKPMDTWLYLARFRRIRRLPPAQRSDPMLGTDIDADSVAGFAASAASFEWFIVGERTILSPFHADNSPTTWSTPPCNYLPDTAWEPREVWELEGTPRDPAYAYSKRLLYVDKETYRVVASNLYDRRGELSKFWTSGWKFDDPSPGSSFATFATMIDMQLGHATWCTFPPSSGWFINTGVADECLFNLSHPMGANPCPSYGSPMRARPWL
jgi:ankyrin repeat protein